MEIMHEGEVTTVLIDPKFDTFTSKEIEAKLMEIVEGGAKKLLCDFSRTEYISSAGLRVMLSAAKKLQKSGGRMALSSMRPFVYDVFKMAGFIQIFDIHKTREEALAGLR
jgi:anti-anti-sigma factor